MREFRHALELLEVTPRAGVAVTGAATNAAVRRMLLRRSQLHVYYAIDDSRRTVHLLAIWHTARGEPPPL